jgi:undecaprenyl diphosphate synthase
MRELPKHIGIIMDGNGRWAKNRNLPRIEGHRRGVEALREVVKTCIEQNINYLTLYAFSLENWHRPQDEVSELMKLLLYYLRKETNSLHKDGVRIKFIGDLSRFDEEISKEIAGCEELTRNNVGLGLTIALSYSGRNEIINAVKLIVSECNNNKIDIEKLDEKLFSTYLYTKELPDPDLIIRTSGEYRISNFLLWQSAYTEFYFTSTLWPDFNKRDLLSALVDYQKRERRYGKV